MPGVGQRHRTVWIEARAAAGNEATARLPVERAIQLKQADLVPLLGSRSQVSDLVNGQRTISKAQVKKLAEFFQVSPELLL